ncbi:MAG: cupin domain-containing protein, partial [Anaerolineales bacterium]
MKIARPLSFLRYLVPVLAALAAGRAAADYPPAQLLLETGTTVSGETLHFPERAPAKIGALTITVKPGESTGWHRHGTPLFAYILSGTLEVEYAGQGRRTYKPGDAFLEAMQVEHIGVNLGTEPVRILALFLEGAGTQRTLPAPPPTVPPASPTATRAPDLVDLAAFD